MSLVLSIIFSILSLLTPAAFAADPALVEAEKNVEIIREGEGVLAVVIDCSPGADTESEEMIRVLKQRSDVAPLISAKNPTPAEVVKIFTDLTATGNGPVAMGFFILECEGDHGDTDEEELKMNGGRLSFNALQKAMDAAAESWVIVIDASRTSYGPTADDVPKSGFLAKSLAISTGGSGLKVPAGGLIAAAAKSIERSKGGTMNLGSFYRDGVKLIANELEIATSMGLSGEGNPWDRNWGKLFLPGGPLILPPPAVTEPPTATGKNWKLPPRLPAYALIGAGGVALGVGSVFAVRAIDPHRALARCATEGCDQTKLTAATASFVKNRNAAAILGGVGIGMIGGGTWWALAGDHQKVSVAFSGDNVTVTRAF